MSEKNQYTFVAQLLHWLVAGLIVAQYGLAELAQYAEGANKVVQELALLANHKSVGMTILALAVFRVVWRIFNTPPALPNSMSVMQRRASHIMHWAIYVLIFTLPLSGWLMSSANAYSVSWFNVFVFPDLLVADKLLASLLHDTHTILSDALLVLVALHVVAALKHHFIDKDDVLCRMASLIGWAVFFLSIVITLGLYGRFFQSAEINKVVEATHEYVGESRVGVERLSDLPVWNINYQQSYIQFTADQAGAPFDGHWTDWQAVMQFDSARLSESVFNVTINTRGVNSNDEERDGYIVGEDFFDVTNYKVVTFVTGDFQNLGSGQYTSQSYLSMKGLSKPVLFTFNVNFVDDKVELNGSARLDRFAWNIGMGDWRDPTWVGQYVNVSVRVIATINK